MTGKYDHGIDGKGRLTVPSQMRRELGEVCFVMRGPKEYLNVYSTEGWEKFCARFEGKTQSEDGDLMRFLFANSATCEIDAQGRVNLVRNDITYSQSEAPRRTEGGFRNRPPRRDSRDNHDSRTPRN